MLSIIKSSKQKKTSLNAHLNAKFSLYHCAKHLSYKHILIKKVFILSIKSPSN